MSVLLAELLGVTGMWRCIKPAGAFMFRQIIEEPDATPSNGSRIFLGSLFLCLFCGLIIAAILNPDGNAGFAAVLMFPLAIIGLNMLIKPNVRRNLISPWLLIVFGGFFIILGLSGGIYKGPGFLGVGILGVWPILLARKRFAEERDLPNKP